MRYRRTGSTYLLYSVGPDGKDDHGRAIARQQGRTSTYADLDSVGDIVAGVVM